MKFLILSALIAVALASPAHRTVVPGITGPTPVVPDHESIAIGPAIVEQAPIVIGPAIVQPDGVSVGPAIVEESVAAPAEETKQPLVQIIINVNEQGQIIGSPAVIQPTPVDTGIVPEPVIVVDKPAEPVTVVEAAPIVIGSPALPAPVITLPEELQ
ncbi:unnamed protein product [Parnassius apollo]|uniref:(apollo) hypothetical protein n=1 Tax=Parnassius apollo TaxID=110799 RepID=A0A8S3WR68_PARAO|nr:unnamed protein product [Parnassius apollo]